MFPLFKRKDNGLDADYVKIMKNSSQLNDQPTFKAVDSYRVILKMTMMIMMMMMMTGLYDHDDHTDRT